MVHDSYRIEPHRILRIFRTIQHLLVVNMRPMPTEDSKRIDFNRKSASSSVKAIYTHS